MSLLTPFVFASLLCFVIWRLEKLKKGSSAKKLNLPPGPPRKPLIGNLLDLPNTNFWLKATEWAEEYGDIVYLNIMGKHFVILNSEQATLDLLEKRSANYSDRQTTTMLHDLVGAGWFFPFAPYGEQWRASRRVFQERFTAKQVPGYREVIRKYSRVLLQQLASTPEAYYDHTLHFASAIIMDSIYGVEIGQSNEPIVETAKQAVSALMQCGTPGAFLVDTFPCLKYWPSWAWGGGFKKQALAWRKAIKDFVEVPYEAALKSMNNGGRQSFVSTWMNKISNLDEDSNQDLLLKVLPGAAGSAFVGGYETTSSTIYVLFLVMILYPEVQEKAHEELDRVVGRERLPEFSDEENLPYIRAIYTELLRWHPIVPFGVPHRSLADDEYHGMFIPKGSIVIGNVWAMLQNEKIYGPNIKDFVPERFMQEGIRKPNAAFGFGRRICPGRHLANESIFMSIASILHLFKIQRPVGSVGEIKAEHFEWTSGVTTHPEPFECSIVPRFEGASELLSKND